MSYTSPNMNLVISTISVDSGLAWEQNLNASLTVLDSHTHASGSGIQIQPNGLNINTDLTFNSNQATNLKAALFVDQTSLATLNALYTVAGELWYNDAAGAVQITSAGTVNATSSGISSGTASASFSAGVLVVNAAASTPANIQGASLLLGNNVASSKYLTLSPPNSMASNYTLVLPAIPSSLSFLTLDTSGNISASFGAGALTTSNLSATAGIVGTQLANGTITATQIANGTITATQIANTTITNNKLAAVNYQLTSSSGTFSDSSGSYVAITNFAATITTVGRPVQIMFVPDGSGSNSALGIDNTSNGEAIGAIKISDGTTNWINTLEASTNTKTTIMEMFLPPGTLQMTIFPSAGTYTYTAYAIAVGGSAVFVTYCKMFVCEL